MAQTKVTDDVREVTEVDAAKITTGTIPEARITSLAASKLTGTVDNARISLDAAEIPNISTDKLTSGELANDRVAALPTSKITSGTFHVDRISEASVTQHVAAVDLTAVHQAIATLGLHTAVSDNKAAFNLPNAFIDTFEDDTGIATETTVDRNASEYISSVITNTTVDAVASKWTHSQAGNPTFSDNTITWTAGDKWIYLNESFSGDFEVQWTVGDTTPPTGLSYICTGFNRVSDEPGVFSSAASIGWYGNNGWWYRDNPEPHYGSTELRSSVNVSEGDRIKFTRVSGVFKVFYDSGSGFVLDWEWGSGQTYTGAVRYGINPGGGGTGSVWEDITYSGTGITGDTVANATGTLVSTVQTAPVATTTLSGVILYTDEVGTNTLDTDLKIYLTANLQGTTPNWTGTNWTDVGDTGGDGGGYGTAQTFSGTTKQVKLGKTTVTSGTAIAMKAVWANQVAASRVTQLHGWAMNY